MRKFVRHTGVAAPIRIDNVDTDQIIPSREMNHAGRQGLAEGLFAGWRYDYVDGQKLGPRPDFVLNQPEFAGASVILGGNNFGCGSSREHAVWALCDYGIRVIIAESFGRIFRSNCARNGLLAIELPGEHISVIEGFAAAAPQDNRIIIDLDKRDIQFPGGDVFEFFIPESDRYMLLNGLDFIEYSLQFNDDINEFVRADGQERSWAYLP